MPIKGYLVKIEFSIAFMAYFFTQDLFAVRFVLIALILALGLGRWNENYAGKSWKYVLEIGIIFFFIGLLEKALFYERSPINSLVLAEILFWFLAILKLVSIYPLRTKVLRWIRS